MQPVTPPGDRVGTCRSPESQCIRVQVQSPQHKPSSTVPFATLLPAAGTMVARWVMGLAEPCLCLAQHTGA